MPAVRLSGVYRQYSSYFIEATEVPLHVIIIREYVISPLQKLLALGNHRLCCNPPELAWRIGWGHAKPGDVDYDPDTPELLRYSLGRLLWSFSQKLDGYGWKKEKRVFSTVISEEDVMHHFHEWRSDILDMEAAEAEEAAGERDGTH